MKTIEMLWQSCKANSNRYQNTGILSQYPNSIVIYNRFVLNRIETFYKDRRERIFTREHRIIKFEKSLKEILSMLIRALNKLA